MYDHREHKKILMVYDGEKALQDMPALIELLLKVPAKDGNAINLADKLVELANKARLVHEDYFSTQRDRFKR